MMTTNTNTIINYQGQQKASYQACQSMDVEELIRMLFSQLGRIQAFF